MGFKIKGAFRRNRKYVIIILIMWVVLAVVFCAPLSYGIANSRNENGIFDIIQLMVSTGQGFKDIFSIFMAMIGTQIYWQTVGYFSIFYLAIVMIGVMKSVPKHEYSDIEHGSSDWAENGEQYKVLNSKEGILLAEKNYLPVDKRGNVNVLVVGRFRFW